MDYWYYVYRSKRTDGTWEHTELARTRFKSDAIGILRNWHSGYIVCNGEIVERKNVDL